jgi:hypothetical protein
MRDRILPGETPKIIPDSAVVREPIGKAIDK